jgi:patatin-like phospholipase/acyl hydrolase
LQQISSKSGKQIPELFDLIMGTSIGGVLAAAYALPLTPLIIRRDQVRFNASEILNLLKDNVFSIFSQYRARQGLPLLFSAKYTRNNIDALLEDKYRVRGIDLRLQDTLVPI